MFTSDCSVNCDKGTKSTVSLSCRKIFHKGVATNECKRKLLIENEACVKNNKACEASYGKWTAFSDDCSGECIKTLGEYGEYGELTNMQTKKRSRICKSDESDQNLCKNEQGEDEVQFCENPTICPLSRV